MRADAASLASSLRCASVTNVTSRTERWMISGISLTLTATTYRPSW
jgi:hypothetical protein